jgi:hypothetical protein
MVGMEGSTSGNPGFGARWKLAWGVLMDAGLARRVTEALARSAAPSPAAVPVPAPAPTPVVESKPTPVELPPERVHASGLALLAALQREGRLVDFLQQDVAGFSDEDVAGAARVVHTGCRRVLKQVVDLGPAIPEAEGMTVSVPAGFDAQRIRLTGNVTGNGPYRGLVQHGGWVAKAVRFPVVSEAVDPRVIAAAEVELS